MSSGREGPRKYARGYFEGEIAPDAERADTRSESEAFINNRIENDESFTTSNAPNDSVLFDEATGRTYYLDEEAGAYYYYDEDAGDYVYYEGDDEAEESADSEFFGAQPDARQTNNEPPNNPQQRPHYAERPDSQPANYAKIDPARKREQRKFIILIIALALVLIASVVASVIISNAKSNDTYDAQMRIGVERFKAGEYEKAEKAFDRALGFYPGDAKASIALSDTFVAEKKYKKAAALLENAKGEDSSNADIIDKLLTLYIKNLDNIPRANELIVECYNSKIEVQNELVAAAPVFNPAGGSFQEAQSVKIKVAKGYKIHYTTSAKTPTKKSKVYKSSIKLRKSKKLTITAVGIAENGLYTRIDAVVFAIDIQYITNSQEVDYVGSSARTIMNSVGPLYYSDSDDGGFYYKTGDDSSVRYRFPKDSLDIPESTSKKKSKKKATADPEKYPLKSGAVCSAISIKIGDYVPQVSGTIAVDDLMSGLDIKKYKVKASEKDGENHLYYSQNGIEFDYALKNKTTVSANNRLTVTRG
jgi:tetratricopeptide (TPR) repeat protein